MTTSDRLEVTYHDNPQLTTVHGNDCILLIWRHHDRPKFWRKSCADTIMGMTATDTAPGDRGLWAVVPLLRQSTGPRFRVVPGLRS